MKKTKIQIIQEAIREHSEEVESWTQEYDEGLISYDRYKKQIEKSELILFQAIQSQMSSK